MVALWALLARRWYFVATTLEPHDVKTPDGWLLRAWHLPCPERRFAEPVVLCHGLANNHRMFDVSQPASLARTLSAAGFDCWLVDLRGAEGTVRRTQKAPHDASIDDHVAYDVPALVAAVLERSGAKEAFWLGHSMGGLVALAAAQTQGLPLKGLVAMGSPLWFDHGRMTRLALRAGILAAAPGRVRTEWLTLFFSPLAGWFRFPLADGMVNHANVAPLLQRRAMASVFAPMWRSVLAQLLDWETHDAFRSRQGVDWRQGLSRLAVPMLLIGGSADLLAGPASLTRALPLLGGEDKSLLLFGRAYGHAHDYGHGDLILGSSAAQEVFPLLVRWLEQRATRAAAAPAPGEARSA